MKNSTIFITTLFFYLVMASTSWALMITDQGTYYGTDVGGVDTFLASTNIPENSNPDAETNWVNAILDSDVTFTLKQEEDIPYYNTDSPGTYAVQLASEPGYFLLKNATYWALFENSISLDWGVFNTNIPDLPDGMNLTSEDLTISHVTELDGTAPVPEPATLLLFGVGLAGLASVRRKK